MQKFTFPPNRSNEKISINTQMALLKEKIKQCEKFIRFHGQAQKLIPYLRQCEEELAAL